MSMIHALFGQEPAQRPAQAPVRVATAMQFIHMMHPRFYTSTGDAGQRLEPDRLLAPEAAAYRAAMGLLELYFKVPDLEDLPEPPAPPAPPDPPRRPDGEGPPRPPTFTPVPV